MQRLMCVKNMRVTFKIGRPFVKHVHVESVGRTLAAICHQAIDAADYSLCLYDDWKALPVELRGAKRTQAVIEGAAEVANAVFVADSLNEEDVAVLAKLMQRLRLLAERSNFADLSILALWNATHAVLLRMSTNASKYEEQPGHDTLCWLRLLIELTIPGVKVRPTSKVVLYPLRRCLSAYLRGAAFPRTHQTALLCGLACWRVLRTQTAVMTAVLSPALHPKKGAFWYMHDHEVLNACSIAHVRDDVIFGELCTVYRRGIQLCIWDPDKLTMLLTRAMSLSVAPSFASPAFCAPSSPFGVDLKLVAADTACNPMMIELLSVCAATLSPIFLSLQFELQQRVDHANKIPESTSSVGGSFTKKRSEWKLRTVSSMISVFVHSGDFSLPLHRSFLEQLVACFIELDRIAEPLSTEMPEEEVTAYAQFHYAMSLLLSSSHFGARLRSSVPPALHRRSTALFVSSHPVTGVESSTELLAGTALIRSLTPAGLQWQQEWVVPGIMIPVDMAIPEKRLILQVDGPTHFVFRRPPGAEVLLKHLSLDELLPVEHAAGGFVNEWKRTYNVLRSYGFAPHYSLRVTRQDALFHSLGYNVLRVPINLLVGPEAHDVLQSALTEALAACERRCPLLFYLPV